MNETAKFFLLTLLATITVLAFVLSNQSMGTATRLARGLYILSLILGLGGLVNTILAASGASSGRVYILINRALTYPGWLVTGTGISSVALKLTNAIGDFRARLTSEAVRSFASSTYLLKALCLSASFFLFAAEIGKSAHDAEMRQFFWQSGYPIWFMYFLSSAETLGAIGLLVAKTRVPAAVGLTVIMLGAIYTHYHNGDPFSDSLDAAHLLILLACIVSMSLLQRRIRNHDAGR